MTVTLWLREFVPLVAAVTVTELLPEGVGELLVLLLNPAQADMHSVQTVMTAIRLRNRTPRIPDLRFRINTTIPTKPGSRKA